MPSPQSLFTFPKINTILILCVIVFVAFIIALGNFLVYATFHINQLDKRYNEISAANQNLEQRIFEYNNFSYLARLVEQGEYVKSSQREFIESSDSGLARK